MIWKKGKVKHRAYQMLNPSERDIRETINNFLLDLVGISWDIIFPSVTWEFKIFYWPLFVLALWVKYACLFISWSFTLLLKCKATWLNNFTQIKLFTIFDPPLLYTICSWNNMHISTVEKCLCINVILLIYF